LSESGLVAPRISNDGLAKQIVWLPDSSQVELKAYSEIKYNYGRIGNARAINLKGEAFFDVKEGKPFKVKFPGGHLQVLGTRFNIQAYSPESGRVDCFEGAVKLSVHQKNYILEKGSSLTFDESSVDGPFGFKPEERQNLPDNVYEWANRPLKEILTLICQREGYQLEAPDGILNKRFTGKVPLKDSGQALKIIATAMDFNYQIENNKLHIFEKE
jgi:ferric-dicitrate binding protein FerR (iron transport regulator)